MHPRNYLTMSLRQLQEERSRIIKSLLDKDAPKDPAERLAYFEQCVCERNNPSALELARVDKALWDKRRAGIKA